jgi:NAD(P)-dependent dehydrogenase (short-subunit alcohol dehydrogenase family)
MTADPPSETLTGRCAAVTGAGRGFGEQAAMELAKLGAAVAVLDVDADAAERCSARLSEGGAPALALTCDVSDDDAVQRAFAQAGAELGPVDILVNNAGIVSSTPFLELTAEEFDRVLAVDYTSMWSCCRAVAPGMVERRFGRIVNISSVAGKRGGGFLGRSAYAAAKAAVIGFTKALARELAPYGVTVNAIAPGAMDTEMTRALSDDPALLARVLSVVPLGRRGVIQDVADAVAFLSSDLSAYLTGETLNVDGGVTME